MAEIKKEAAHMIQELKLKMHQRGHSSSTQKENLQANCIKLVSDMDKSFSQKCQIERDMLQIDFHQQRELELLDMSLTKSSKLSQTILQDIQNTKRLIADSKHLLAQSNEDHTALKKKLTLLSTSSQPYKNNHNHLQSTSETLD
jgi:hypothetical protein